MQASSKRPRVDSSSGFSPPLPPSSGDPVADEFIDPTTAAAPPPSTSDDSSICCMLDIVMIVQATHDQLLVELASFWWSPPPPPFDDEWLPFGNSSQKGGVHMAGDKGRFFCCFGALKLWIVSRCFTLYLFLAHDVSIFYVFILLWVVYDRGRHYIRISISCFTLCFIDYWFIFMRLFMIYIFNFMLCKITNLFCFTCIFHTCVYVFVKCYRNIQVNLVVLLSILATDR